MKALVYDTETSGLPLFKEPSEDPRQPHIVQLAALLVDLDTRTVLDQMDVIVRPDGWEIPADVAALHGITQERALAEGISERMAVEMFCGIWLQADFRLAHNEQFDARIVRIALKRFEGIADSDVWKAGKAECTQRLATPLMKLPPTAKMVRAGFLKYKSANLKEAYQHFCGAELQNAHTASADARACLDVYFAIQALRTQAGAA